MLVKLSGQILAVLVLDGRVHQAGALHGDGCGRTRGDRFGAASHLAYIEDELKAQAAADLAVRIRRRNRRTWPTAGRPSGAWRWNRCVAASARPAEPMRDCSDIWSR